MNALKTGTSRRLRTMFAQELAGMYSKPVLWSRSYCVLSCGGAPLEIIQQYIQQQAGCAYPSSQWGRFCLQAASGQPKWMEPLALFGGGEPL